MKPLFDADYSAIEARIVCWLAGQEDALQEYRDGIDRYRVMASMIYSIPAEQVNKFPQRFIGKQAILGSGFQGGGSSLRRMCEKFGYKTMPAGLEDKAVEAYRQKHPKVKSYWYDVEKCAQRAIMRKGEIVKLRNIAFLHEETNGLPFLFIRLPSGRKLAYPRPRLVPHPRYEGKMQITFFGRSGVTTSWNSSDTYGGKLVENIAQAVAADIMCTGAQNAENAGYGVMALIHDQALSYTAPGQTAGRFVELLTNMPAWADGLPIAAEGSEVEFYKKD